MTENTSWLINCPASDWNFKTHLKSATVEEIEDALKNLDIEKTAKTKINALFSELRRKSIKGGK